MEKIEGKGTQRWTAKRRVALVVSLLRGETSLAEAARAHGLTIGKIEDWRDKFLLGGENALRSKPKDEEALRDEQIKRLKQKVGELVLDLDILKKANKSCAFRVMAHIRSRQTLAPEFFHFRRIIYRNVEY